MIFSRRKFSGDTLLCLMVFLAMLSTFGAIGCVQPALASPFVGGSGTSESPYQVSTPEQLNSVRDAAYLDKSFELINDLDLSEMENWVPIGTDDAPFTGTFDGNLFCIALPPISSVEVDPDGVEALEVGAGQDNVGLFGVSRGVVKNLEVQAFSGIDGASNIGVVVGHNDGGLIANSVAAIGSSVQGTSNVGGLAGKNDGMISRSYVILDAGLTGVQNVGGLVGAVGSGGSVENSFALSSSGFISGESNVGGLAGLLESGCNIQCTYAAVDVAGISNAGGLVGTNSGGTVSASYYDTDVAEQSDIGKGIPKTTADMQAQGTFDGWDFAEVWRFPLDHSWMTSYPSLRINLPASAVQALTPEDEAVGVGIDAPLSVEFDRNVHINDANGIRVEYEDESGQIQELAEVTAEVTGGDTVLINHPDFTYGTTYFVTISENSVIGYSNYAWNTGNEEVTWSFVTNGAGFIDFGFSEQTGESAVDSAAGTIHAEVKYGTDLSNLVASFAVPASVQSVQVAGVDQVSGVTANDFSLSDISPVTYTVAATDGTIKDFKVTVAVAPDKSGFGLALAEAGDKVHGETFAINISNAKDVYGADLDGDIDVTITSDQADGEVVNQSVRFTDGAAAVSISLDTMAVHHLTVNVTGVTGSRSLTLNVISEPAPSPQALTPSAGGASLDLNQPVKVEFDREIAVNDLSGIKIEYATGGTTQSLGGVSGSLNGRTLTLTHDQFIEDTVYTVTIPTNAVLNVDDIGNAAISWEFTVLPVGYFAGGSGTEQDPFLVASAAQLDNVRGFRRLHYRLINDLDLSSYDNWNPIGDSGQPFAGAFDGDYHLISNLEINRADEDYVGLFGHSLGGVIKNLSVAGKVSGRSYVGILVGSNYTMEIVDGRTLVATISDCSASGTVAGTSYVGGLAGLSYGQISNSFSTAAVSGSNDVGGLAGRLMKHSAVNSYATGAVTGANRVGGLLGSMQQSGAEVKTCFAAGGISGSGSVGGLVGYRYSGAVSDSYYDSQTTGRAPNGLGTPKTTAEMQDQATFVGWDFDSVWSMQADTYPFLQALSPFPIAKTMSPADGARTVAVDAAVSVEFDQDVTIGDLSGIKIEYDDGGTMRLVTNVTAALSGRTLAISHDRFAYGTEYTVTIPASAVTSSALHGGNPGFTWGFTTDPASMLSYGFAEQTGSAVIDHAAGAIEVEVRYGTDLSHLVATFTTSTCIQSVQVNDSDQTSGATANDFQNPVTYTLKADGLTRTYVVTVSVAADQSGFVAALAAASDPIAGAAFGLELDAARDVYGDELNGDSAVTITSDLEDAVFSGSVSFHNGQASVENVTLTTEGEHALTITVAGITGSRNLSVTVVPPPSSDKAITAFGFLAAGNNALTSDVSAVISGTEISALLPHGTDLTALVASFTTTGKTVRVGGTTQASGDTKNDFNSPVTYTVTAEDGSSQNYTVTVTVDPDQSAFALAMAAGAKQTGMPFVLSITDAKDCDGRYLNGTVGVEVIIEDIGHAGSEAETLAQLIAFTDGQADVSITITSLDPAISITTYRLTVSLPGITASQSIECLVEQQPAPAAQSLTPADGAVGLALDSSVCVLFDREVTANDLSGVEMQWLDGQTYRKLTGTSAAIQPDGHTLVISHGQFKYGTEYRVVIPSGTVENTAGIANSNLIGWVFTTRAAPDAGIVLQTPAADAQAVAVDAVVSIEFNRAITARDLTDIKIEYVKNGVTLAADGVHASLGGDNRTLAITHSRFAYDTTYTVTIPEGAFSDADGLNNPAITWSFTTKPEPIATQITYSPDSLTNGDVTAELIFVNTDTGSAPSQNPYSALETVHKFVDNGTYTFIYSDGEGNSYSLDAEVNWIDKTPPTATITYTPAANTKYGVQATVEAEDDRGGVVVFTQPGGANTYTFAANGTYDFQFRDEAGNVNAITATVDWIKPACQPQIAYSTESPTQAAVTATISFPGWTGVQITNNDGNDTYTFEDNGEFAFTYRDPDGDEGSAVANVAWIDRVAPSGQLSYDPATHTNGSVTVTILPTDNLSDYAAGEIKIIQPADSVTHTFKYNGSFDFILEDAAGNRGTVTAVVDWIDRQITDNLHVEYSTTDPAPRVVATVIVDNLNEGIHLTPQGQPSFHLFEANGEYTWQFADAEGNNGSITAKVDWIDRLAPTMAVTYSPETFTNQAVVVTITGADSPADADNIMSGLDGLTCTASDSVTYVEQGEGVYTLTFSDNASVQVVLKDKAGNAVQQTIKVDWIDHEPPNHTVQYSSAVPAKDNVVVTIALHDHNAHPTTIVNADQLPDYVLSGENNDYCFAEAPVFTFTFTENGSYTFKASDQAGNITEILVEVTNIDKVPPAVELTYSTEENTPYEVKAYLRGSERFYDGLTHQAAERVFDDAAQFLYFQMEHTFWVNGEHTFVYEDQVGNSGQATASVNWIENRPPEVHLEYFFPRYTNGTVQARLFLDNDFHRGFHIAGNGSNTHTFSENGSFTFEYANNYGATGQITATVDWIDKTPPVVDQISYSPGGSSPTLETYSIISVYGHDDESGMMGTGVDKFTVTANGDYIFEISDRVGNKTQIPLTVTWIDRTPPEVIPQGDFNTVINQNLTITLVANERVTVSSAYMPYEYNGASFIQVDQQNELTTEHTAVLQRNGIYRISCQDVAGNETRIEFEVKNIDKQPPTICADSQPIQVVSRKEEGKIPAILKMRASDDRDGDLTAKIAYLEVSRQRDDGDEEIVYQCSVQDAAGNSSTAITRTVVISAKTRPTFYVDGQVAGGKITRTLAPGETAASVALDYAGFLGEYALKMAVGEKPAAFFKSALTSRIFYSSEFSEVELPPLLLAPGVYTIYGYDAETGYVALVIEVKGGK